MALYFSSDQADITVGGPVSTRYHRELERQVGLYGSTYVLRTVFSDTENIEQLLHRTRGHLLEAYRHQVQSISQVLEKFEFELDLSRTAPYDVSIASHMFDLPLCDPEVARTLGIRISPFRYPLTTSFFDFEFTFHLFDGEIELESRYDAAIYRKETVLQIAQNFRSILFESMRDPSQSIGDLRQHLALPVSIQSNA
jgi:non-ribosomal peptide synthetase component F